MKKVNLLVLLVALSILAWAVPAAPLQAATHNAVLTAQQEEEPTQAAAEEAEAQTFTGQIAQHEGKYVLQGDDNKAYQLDDQEKVKEFDGKKVNVSGTLDEENMTIHVSNIEELEEPQE